MQVIEKKSEGLSHEFTIIVPPEDIEAKTNAKLQDLAGEVTIPGFRPGKVPPSVIRQRYGQAVRGEVLETVVGEAMASALSERNLQPAMQPKVEVQKFDEGGELEFTLAVDVLPEIDPVDFKTIEVERMKVAVDDAQVDKSIEQMAEQMAQSEPIKGKRKSKKGDIVVIDFEGKVDGELFEGGTAKDYQLTLGSSQFFPGFEDQLTGAAAGDDVTVSVTMPAEYPAENLAGKDAVFACTVKEIREKKDAEINDEFAKNLGMDSLDAMKAQIRERMEGEYSSVCRERMKRQLLDKLDTVHAFEVPGSMVDAEFDSIWQQYLQAKKDAPEDAEDDEVEDPEEFYRGVAQRRVRLGLLLAAVGQHNNLDVSPEEINRALIAEAQRYPGQEQKIIEMYSENEQAMANIRAPLFEDKVVDFIVEMAQVSEREVTLEELTAEMEAEQKEAEEKSKPKKKSAAKKKAAPKKKAPAKKKTAAEKADKAADDGDDKEEK
jgi:trigger factor